MVCFGLPFEGVLHLMGKARWQDCAVVGHIASTVRKQSCRERCTLLLRSLPSCSQSEIPLHGMMLPMFQVGLPSLVFPQIRNATSFSRSLLLLLNPPPVMETTCHCLIHHSWATPRSASEPFQDCPPFPILACEGPKISQSLN